MPGFDIPYCRYGQTLLSHVTSGNCRIRLALVFEELGASWCHDVCLPWRIT